ncbi:MAG: kinase, partial [Muribaculaceae bacterium]|nr:kinase [Muribaculaceae bacterium]
MAKTIKLTATDGTPVEFVDEVIGSGAMKDVYFSPDKSYVVGFFRQPQDANAKDRLQNIVGKY